MLRRAVAVVLGLAFVGRVALAGPAPAAPAAPPAPDPAAPAPAPDPAAPAPAPDPAAPAPADPAAAPAPDAAAPAPRVPDPAAAAVAVTPDLASTGAEPPPADHRLATALGLAGTYAALGAWMWYAWYYNKPTLPHWKFGGDGWMGDTTYAGGADKGGHFWANLVFSRLGTDLLRKGGWGKLSSSLVATGICLTTFFFVEVKDGFYYEFSPSDMTGNTLGALAALAMSNWPALDDAIDFRVQWFPSVGFRRKPSADFVEDYSGETYLLAYKPRSLRAVREADGPLKWLQYVNPVIGFDSRNYKPTPLPGETVPRRQDLFIGLTIDMQAVIDETLGGRSSKAARWSQNFGHTVFEFVNLPYTTLPVLTESRSPDTATP